MTQFDMFKITLHLKYCVTHMTVLNRLSLSATGSPPCSDEGTNDFVVLRGYHSLNCVQYSAYRREKNT